jgi:Mn2+/Fe2+ NRAMP family transporter
MSSRVDVVPGQESSGAPAEATTDAPVRLSFAKLLGPGLIVAATGIGSGDVVSTTVGGARYGSVLLWAIALGAFLKFVLTEGIARWQLATGTTALEGWATYLPRWVKVYFGLYLFFWTISVSAALTNASGLGIANLTGGLISQQWGAILHSLIGFAFVWVGGFKFFEKVMKVLIGLMGFSILICASLTLNDPLAIVRGLLIPRVPAGSNLYVLSLVGAIGGSVTMLAYNYWMREEDISGPRYLTYVRGDIAAAYLFTAVFGMSIMLIANQAFYIPGTQISDGDAVPRMAATLGSTLGAIGFYAYSIGFWAAVFASLLGAWQSIPYLFADFYGVVRKVSPERRRAMVKVTSTPYRIALLFITLAPMPFAFIGRPLFIIITYTVVASLFVPFLAATLLYLNNRVAWTASVPKNHWVTNVVLVIIIALFFVVGSQEVFNLLRSYI